MPRLLLVLDDDRARLRGFEAIVPRLGDGWSFRAWRAAPAMIADLDRHLADAGLISLDCDLYRDFPDDLEPGTGRMVADWLASRPPVCPVLVHSTNTDAAWGLHNALRGGGWTVELVHHLGQPDWIEASWLPVALRLVSAHDRAQLSNAGETLSLSEYREIVRPIPVPTPQQVRQFAEYVAGAHSWYKHLRLLPARTPLQVFLDPAAGMQLALSADGKLTVARRDRPGFHYSWLPTAEHRERFGHLAFSKSSGTSVSLLAADGSRVIGSDNAPRIHDPATAASYQLPDEALMAGRAFVSGIVHTAGASRYLWEGLIQHFDGFDDVLDPIDRLEIAKRILDRCAVLKADPSRAEPAAPLTDEPYHEWRLSSFDLPLEQLVAAERERQIQGIADAATRVIRLLYANRCR